MAEEHNNADDNRQGKTGPNNVTPKQTILFVCLGRVGTDDSYRAFYVIVDGSHQIIQEDTGGNKTEEKSKQNGFHGHFPPVLAT
jgi:hypothetical protein